MGQKTKNSHSVGKQWDQVFNEIWRVIWGSADPREGCVLYKDSHCFWRREEKKWNQFLSSFWDTLEGVIIKNHRETQLKRTFLG